MVETEQHEQFARTLTQPLKLRRDAVYLRTEEGILFRTRDSTFVLKGANIYATFRTLVPYLDGTIDCYTLTKSVRKENRQAVGELLGILLQRSVLRAVDVDDAALLERSVSDVFRPN